MVERDPDDAPSPHEHRRMNDQPGLGELARGLLDLKQDLRALTTKVEELPEKFADRAVSLKVYESDEKRRAIEIDALTGRVDSIDEWKQGSTRRTLAIIATAASIATSAAAIFAVING